MIAVDLWKAQPKREIEGSETYEAFDHEGNFRRFSQFCGNHLEGRVEIIRTSTHDASRFVKDKSLDFVFIDADHTYEGCKQDIIDWHTKIREGGLISGHDINWPSVRKAVDEAFVQYTIFPDNVWVASL